MDKIAQIISNPLYCLLFGGGGILIIALTIIPLFRKNKEKKKDDNININIDINNSNPNFNNNDNRNNNTYNLEFETRPVVDKHEEYQEMKFREEEYYISFLKTIEEKRKEGDKVEYK